MIIENDNIEKNEKELWIKLYLNSKENKFSLIKILNENKSLILNEKYNDINYHDFLMNNKWLSIIIWRKNYKNVNKSIN